MKRFSNLITVLLLLAACAKTSQPSTYVTANSDTFKIDNEDNYKQASKLLQADYMFVMDVSASMDYNSADEDPRASKRAEFMAGLDTFIDELENPPPAVDKIDYKIGFISGNFQGDTGADALKTRGFFNNIFLTPDLTNTELSSYLNSLSRGIGFTLAANTTAHLEATDSVLKRQGDSFIRDGSQLVYIFVSDGDDVSNAYFSGDRTTTTYAKKLIAHKGSGTGIEAFVSARAIVAGVNDYCTPDGNFGESTGTRLAETARKIEVASRSVATANPVVTNQDVSRCILRASTDFPELLGELARDVSKPTNIFQLQVANVVTNTIKVYVNGAQLLNSVGNTKWTYIPASNAVKLTTVPAPGASVKLTYNQYFVLSRVPADPNALQVKLNSSVLLQDASSGWTYNAAANRIEFGSNVTLTNGSNVQVSYQ